MENKEMDEYTLGQWLELEGKRQDGRNLENILAELQAIKKKVDEQERAIDSLTGRLMFAFLVLSTLVAQGEEHARTN